MTGFWSGRDRIEKAFRCNGDSSVCNVIPAGSGRIAFRPRQSRYRKHDDRFAVRVQGAIANGRQIGDTGRSGLCARFRSLCRYLAFQYLMVHRPERRRQECARVIGLPRQRRRTLHGRTSNAADLEWDLYGGYKGTLAADWTYDVGLIRYYYPGRFDNLGAYRRPNTTEIYGAISYKWLTLKYFKAASTYTFGVNESKGASYLDLSAQIPLGETGCNLIAHVGRQNYPGNTNVGYWGASGGNNDFFDYTDYKLGLTKEYAGFTIGLAWTYADTKDTAPDGNTTTYMNAFGKNIGRDRVVLSVSRTF